MRTKGMFVEVKEKPKRGRKPQPKVKKKKKGIQAATSAVRKQTVWEEAKRGCYPSPVVVLLEARIYRADLKTYTRLPGWKIQLVAGELRELEGLRMRVEKLLEGDE